MVFILQGIMKKRGFILFALLMMATVAINAQELNEEKPKEKKSGFETKIEAGYMMGLLINLNFVVYNAAYTATINAGYRVNDYFVAYGGIGLERLEDGVLVPFYVNLESYFSPKKTGFFDVRVGYSGGFNNRSINIDYKYRGGALFAFGIGRDLYKNEQIRLAFSFSYNYRQARYDFRAFDDEERLTSRFNYHLISGKLAFVF